ncbi:MAG: PstS family phosphate ABC transporter substrate-binding protein [Methanohalobium sp.]|uniref:PstS family phosphate ABC transporter substrate-binding protein n=1 Tax=Methanohalobium sp. TaxID=2837493 RepID=UPI003977FC05
MKKEGLTKTNIKKTVLMLIGILVFSVALAGCVSDTEQNGNGEDQQSDTEQNGNGEDQQLSGEIIIDGSSTVYPISQAMTEEFEKNHPDVSTSVSSSGTGGGFQKFTEGETDINDASRPIKASESQTAKENGIRYVEFKIATDGVTVVTNKNADWYDSLSMDELAGIWGPDNRSQKWSDVNSEWPDEEMKLYGPTSASGTFDFFTEEVMGEEDSSRTDYQKTENDNFIINGVRDSEYAMGYLGYAYYQQNENTVKAAPIDDVEPTQETISTGEYPFSRPIFIYVNIDRMEDKPELREFVKFYLESSSSSLISDVGYVPVTDTQQKEIMDKFDEVINGDYEVNYKS